MKPLLVGKRCFMLLIKYTDQIDFEYDIQGILRSFYPGEETVTDKENEKARLIIECGFHFGNMEITLSDRENYKKQLSFDIPLDENNQPDRKEAKNIMKRKLYDLLHDYSKITLPWGTLSGIRPAKITTSLLESGMTKDEVKSHMRQEYYLSDIKTDKCIDISTHEIEVFNKFNCEDEYSIYIGIPFCPSTCLYCSFTSYPIALYEKKADDYITALCKELDYIFTMYPNKRISSIYIGGGTPTSISAFQLERILKYLDSKYDTSTLREYCVEAGRPDSITREKLEVLKKYGVSRISINPQTLKDETLKIIGRHHTTEQFYEAYELAREVGFDNINMDFILGLPDENKEDIIRNMEKVRKLNPDSLTVHSLALKRAARLNMFKDKYKDYAFSNSEEFIRITEDCANDLGMKPYYLYRQKNMQGNLENTGYATVGKEGLYNILIMEEKQDIIAAGAGASTKMVKKVNNETQIERIINVKNVDIYIERIDEMIARKREYMEQRI